MVFLTVSTGIGAGIVLNGQLVEGRFGLAGHAGQMIALMRAPSLPGLTIRLVPRRSRRRLSALHGCAGTCNSFLRPR